MIDIKKYVDKITKKYYTTNPKELCQSLGIEIIKDNIYPIKAYYTKSNKIKIITLDHNLKSKEQDIVIAHEIGHSLLHKDISTTFYHNFTKFSTGTIENEANIFAMHLTLKRYQYDIQDCSTLDEISHITGLNINLLHRFYK